MTIHIDGAPFRAELHAMALEFDAAAAAALEAALRAGEEDAAATTLYNDRTRRLRSSTKGTIDRPVLRAKLRNTARYASFVETGTRPHPIRPKMVGAGAPAPGQTRRTRGRERGFLRFKVGGSWVFRRMVNHPGTRPRPFLRHASQVGTTALYASLEKSVNTAIDRFNGA